VLVYPVSAYFAALYINMTNSGVCLGEGVDEGFAARQGKSAVLVRSVVCRDMVVSHSLHEDRGKRGRI
jgi:hypothetical protein